MAYHHEPVAVIGTSCRFPGGANSPSKLWDLLIQPRDIAKQIPPGRFNVDHFYHKHGQHHGTSNVRESYFLDEDPRLFDATFFNIHAREVESIDPQQRLLLETVYEGLESAGMTLDKVQGSQTAVYVGAMTYDFKDQVIGRDIASIPEYAATGTSNSILANRLSYYFDCKGPSMTIDTACSSSLVAVHLAVQSLRNGEATMAIAAGSNVILGPEMYIAESNLKMLSPTGRSRMWDANADGYARGEGFASVILKTLSQALADGDDIEFIIRETGVGQDGRTKGITMPSPLSQASLIEQTYQKAGLDPKSPVDRPQYFEAHGTGTKAGDPVEAEAIYKAFYTPGDESDTRLLVGSIKSVVGHLEGTAGLAGLIKAALSIRNQEIPPNLHFNQLNPAVKPFYHRLEVPLKRLPWPSLASGTPKRASINSFGFGGTNCHVIIESYEPKGFSEQTPQSVLTHSINQSQLEQSQLLVTPLLMSAKSESSLIRQCQEVAILLEGSTSIDIQSLLHTYQSFRNDYLHKVIFTGCSQERIVSSMKLWLDNGPTASKSSTRTNEKCTLGVFTGQGAQWPAMGRKLFENSRMAQRILSDLDKSLGELPDGPDWSIIDELLKDATSSRLNEAAIAQPLCTAVQIVLVDHLHAAKVKLDVVIGHSSGEIAAAYAAGFLTSRDAIRIAYYRGLYAKLAHGENDEIGRMMAVGTSLENAQDICNQDEYKGKISVAASNSPSSVTLSGDKITLEGLKVILDEQKVFARLLKVDTAYHSHHMLPCSGPYSTSLEKCDIRPTDGATDCQWISSVYESGKPPSSTELSGSYWVDNMLKPVRFSQALQNAIRNHNPSIIIELGPHPALKGPSQETTSEMDKGIIPHLTCLRRAEDAVETTSDLLGQLWQLGGKGSVDFEAYHEAFFGPKTFQRRILKDLPSYSWDHQVIHWRENHLAAQTLFREEPVHELLGSRWGHAVENKLCWRNLLSAEEIPWLRDHQVDGNIIVPGTAYAVMAIEAIVSALPQQEIDVVEIEGLNIRRALILREEAPIEILFNLNITDPPTPSKIVADFYCTAPSAKSVGNFEKVFDGRIIAYVGDESSRRWTKVVESQNMRPLDSEKFYEYLETVGYRYTGDFRAMRALVRKHNQAKANIPALETDYLIHPATLDLSLQCLLAGFDSPEEQKLWTPLVPRHIDRIRIDASLLRNSTRFEMGDLMLHSQIMDFSYDGVTGDCSLYDESGHVLAQLESILCPPLTRTNASEDRNLFSTIVWKPDVSSQLALPRFDDSTVEQELIKTCERVSYFYYREFKERIHSDDLSKAEWHHRRLFEYIDHIFDEIDQGLHPLIQPGWKSDQRAEIIDIIQSNPDSADLQLIYAVGENLPRAIREHTPILQYMMEDNRLTRYYTHGLGYEKGYVYMESMVDRIVHRYPNLKILEIGAGTGGATRGVLTAAGDRLHSYTFTDISAGFFDTASMKFERHSSKMIFKTLDIEKDAVAQGFQEHSYGLVVASLVIHATASLMKTLHNVRRLMKPGGHLILIEGTGKILRTGFVMSGLSGWWLGADDDRKWGPMVSSDRWHSVLRDCGFSGIETIAWDNNEPTMQGGAVFTTQAVDAQHTILRKPLSAPLETQDPGLDHVTIVGGASPRVSKIRQQLITLLQPRAFKLLVVDGLEQLLDTAIPNGSSVLDLTELDNPAFRHLTGSKFQALQTLFSKVSHALVLLRETGEDHEYTNIKLGICRSLRQELSGLFLETVFVEGKEHETTLIADELVRLTQRRSSSDTDRIWTDETELAIRDGTLMIPRVVMNKQMNYRLNSPRRKIMHQFEPLETRLEIKFDGPKPALGMATPFEHEPDSVEVQVSYSTLQLLDVSGDLGFLCLGKSKHHSRPLLALSTTNQSIVTISKGHYVETNTKAGQDALFLYLVTANIIAQNLLRSLRGRGTLVVIGADSVLEHALRLQASVQQKRVFYLTEDYHDEEDCTTKMQITQWTSRREIKTCLKSLDVTGMWDLSANSKIARDLVDCFPNVVRYEAFSSYSRYRSDFSTNDLNVALKDVVRLAQDSLQAFNSLPADTFSLGLNDSLALDQPKALKVVDWTKDRPISLQAQPLDATSLFQSDKTYLLIGLTSDLGQSLCEWMYENGARYIVLSSRRPNIDQAWLDDMSEKGAVVKKYSLDVTSKPEIQRFRREIATQMPTVAGLANGAMVLRDSSFFEMSLDQMLQALAPKVDGTRYLDEVFGDLDLDFFIMFSSLAWVIGNRGQSNYAAANGYMAAFARSRHARGLKASTINLGVVNSVGYVAREGRGHDELSGRLKIMTINEHELHTAFAEAIVLGDTKSNIYPELLVGLGHTIVSKDATSTPPWLLNPIFSQLRIEEDEQQRETYDAQPKKSTKGLKEEIIKAPDMKTAFTVLETGFMSKVASMLRIAPDSLISSSPLVDLGIDSLLAVEIRSWLTKELGVDISVLNILSGNNFTEISSECFDQLDNSGAINGSSISNSPNQSSVVGSTDTNLTSTTDIEHGKADVMSYAQRRMFTLYQQTKKPIVNNATWSYSIEGWIHIPLFKRAFQHVLQIHEPLRTKFFVSENDGTFKQEVLPKPLCSLEYISNSTNQQVMQVYDRIANHQYDLEAGDTTNATLLSLSEDSHVLIIGLHHIVFDLHSIHILMRDLDMAYRQWEPTSNVNLFRAFAAEEQRKLEDGTWNDDIAYWKAEFTQVPKPITLFPFAKVQERQSVREPALHHLDMPLGMDRLDKIRDVAAKLKTSAFHIHLSVLQVLLQKLLGENDFCIGLVDANRNNEKYTETFGPFFNYLPVNFHLEKAGSQNFESLAITTRQKAYAAHSHGHIPFDVILDEVGVDAKSIDTYHPLYQVQMNYVTHSLERPTMGDLFMEAKDASGVEVSYDLVISIFEGDKESLLFCYMQKSLYTEADTARVRNGYLKLLDAFVEDPSLDIKDVHVEF